MKIQKALLTLAVGIIIVPTMAQAAWWNPFSWLNSNETNTVTEVQVSSANFEGEQIVIEDAGTQIEPDTESTSPIDATVSPTISTNNEIDALKREIKELRSVVQISPTTNAVPAPTQQASNDTAINAQILETLSKLEKRIEVLESQIKNQDYGKILTRIESLEKEPAIEVKERTEVMSSDEFEGIKSVISILCAGSYNLNSTSFTTNAYFSVNQSSTDTLKEGCSILKLPTPSIGNFTRG